MTPSLPVSLIGGEASFFMIETFSDAALHDALIKELCSGRKLMEEKELMRQEEAKREAQSHKGHRSNSVLGKHVMTIPQHDYMIIGQKYGFEAFHDKGFLRDMQRHLPDFASNKI